MVNALRRIAMVLMLALAGMGTMLAQDTAATAAKPRYDTWWLPDASSTVAGPIDDLFYIILWITSAVFILVFSALIIFIIKYRHREGRRAVYTHGNNRLEVAWTVIPALILVFLAVISQSVWSDIKLDAPLADTSLVVSVMPRQFQWDIRYAGADGKFQTPDDITATNQLHVPMGRTVLLNMTAQDVIHSFFVPEFRMKQDAVPGMVTRYWFTATKSGAYEIACAELCGLGHYRMRGFLTVHPPEEFDAWYAAEIAKKAKQLTPPVVAAPPASAPVDTTSGATSADATAAGALADSAAAPTDTAAH
jgi:cytochrome c oxidase subunit II